jgi:flagellar motor switch protein FliG
MPSTAITKPRPIAVVPSASASPRLTKPQKAALLIGALGKVSAKPVLESLDEAALRHFAAAMSTLRQIRPDTINLVIDEFLIELESAGLVVAGGLNHVRELLKDYVSDAVIERIMAEINQTDQRDIWHDIIAAPAGALADVLAPEHPQIAAVVIARLSAERAAEILTRFDSDHARDIVIALSDSRELGSDVLAEIGRVLHEGLSSQPKHKPSPPTDRIGSIMNFTPGPIRDHILAHFESTNPQTSAAIRRKMFTFEDISTRIAPRDIGTIAQAIDENTLLRALVGAEKNAAETRDFVLGNMSKRMASQLEESMAELGTVKPADSDLAQLDVIRTIRQLVDDGTITLEDQPEADVDV